MLIRKDFLFLSLSALLFHILCVWFIFVYVYGEPFSVVFEIEIEGFSDWIIEKDARCGILVSGEGVIGIELSGFYYEFEDFW